MSDNLKTVCICGGGSQGHISAGVIGSNKNYKVNILTRHPEKWVKDFETIDLTGKSYKAELNKISSNPADVIPESDIILICLPGYAIRGELELIKPFVSVKAIIGCAFGGSGFFLQLFDVFGTKNVPSFALQRVPFTGRPGIYGHTATLKGYKPYLKVAINNCPDPDDIVKTLNEWYNTPVFQVKHWLEVTLSNSNPLLHPCRMRVMFKDWQPGKVYDHIPYMYNTDWDDESSQCWLDCDNELREVMSKLPMDSAEVPSLLEYYGCSDTKSLTQKMQSIEPFKTVLAHMIETPEGYLVDPETRYFTEDIPYGLLMIKAFGELTDTPTPHIDDVIMWAQKIMGKNYLTDSKINGELLDGELSFISPSRLRDKL